MHMCVCVCPLSFEYYISNLFLCLLLQVSFLNSFIITSSKQLRERISMLILLLRFITFSVLTLWSILTRLIFSSLAHLVVLLIQGLKFPGEAAHGGFQQLAEAIRGCFEFLISMVVESVSFMVTTVFDIVKEGVTGSVDAFADVAAKLSEKLKTSLDESVNYVADISGELSEMVTNMVAELWNNYKEAVGYVLENAAA